MIGEKVMQYQQKHTDLGELTGRIQSYLEAEGFSVQTSPQSNHGTVIQAKKGRFLAEVIDADRAMTIMLAGSPDDFTVRIGIGKWLKHLGVAAVETLLLSDLFLVVDVAESAWSLEIEDRLVKQIDTLIG
jgi:hypothetical protein